MSLCNPERRQSAKSAARELEAVPSVFGIDVIEPSADATNRWTVELSMDTDGLPAVVAAILAEYGLVLRHVGPRGPGWHAVAVVGR